MSTITREAFLGYTQLPREEVKISELSGAVWVRTLNARERDRYEVGQDDENKKERGANFRARLVVATACNQDGTALFTEADIPALSERSCAIVDPIVNAALRLNKFTKADTDELEKN